MELTFFNQSFEHYLHQKLAQAPENLKAAILYSCLRPGQRLRPMIFLATPFLSAASAHSAQGPVQNSTLLEFAFGLEIYHSFSLIHDDLPCMDNDDVRSGRPTTHRQFPEAIALLAGDECLRLSLEAMTHASLSVFSTQPSLPVEPLFNKIHECLGFAGVIGGQALEFNTLTPQGSTWEGYLNIIQRKTGALFVLSYLAPFLLQPHLYSAQHLQQVETWAKCFGKIYQIADDLEDPSSVSLTSSLVAGSFKPTPTHVLYYQDFETIRTQSLQELTHEFQIFKRLFSTSSLIPDFTQHQQLFERLHHKLTQVKGHPHV
jgi:geranylgeranyl pyrophosphate synthase